MIWQSGYPIKETKAEPTNRNPWWKTQTKEQPKAQAEVAENGTDPADARDEHPIETVEEKSTEDK